MLMMQELKSTYMIFRVRNHHLREIIHKQKNLVVYVKNKNQSQDIQNVKHLVVDMKLMQWIQVENVLFVVDNLYSSI